MINVNDKIISIWGWDYENFRSILDECLFGMQAYVLVMLYRVRVSKVQQIKTKKDACRSPV